VQDERCGFLKAPIIQKKINTMWFVNKNDEGVVRLSEGRGQNNQQPTPNDNNKRVVVFLYSSGI